MLEQMASWRVAMWPTKNASAPIGALLTAISLAGCAASLNDNAGSVWGKPAEMAPTTGSASDPPIAQANVARVASSIKTNGSASDGTVSGPSPRPASGPRTADAPDARISGTTGFRISGAYEIGRKHLLLLAQFRTTLMPTRSRSAIVQAALAQPC